jgi:DNA polymerase-3 subunit gamma/tau
LEEPPPHIKFLLATTDPQKIPVTVLSRCLQFNLKHLRVEQIRTQIEHILHDEKIAFEPRAVPAIARAAQGSMRDGLSLLDQAIAHGGGQLREAEVSTMLGTIARKPVFDLLTAIADHDAAALLQRTEELAEHTPNFADALQQMLNILHHAAIAQWAPEILKREEDAEQIAALAKVLSAEDLQLFYQIALLGQRDLPLASDPHSGFEMTLLRMLAFRPATTEPRYEVARQTAPPPTRPLQPAKSVAEPAAPECIEQPSPHWPPDSDWASILAAMNLAGMSREMANHSVLRTLTRQTCHLALDRQYEQLRTPQVERTLERALQEHFRRPIKLTVSVEGVLDDTPAIRQQRAREERQRAAELTISQDENVKAFQELFGAQVVPGSVRPLD